MYSSRSLVIVLILFLYGAANAQIINTIAGKGTPGYNGDSILANDAKLFAPYCARTDKAGNIFIADYGNNSIRKVNAGRMITTAVGTGGYAHSGDGGPATAATLTSPTAVAFDKKGNMYIAEDSFSTVGDIYISWIRKVDTFGMITTIAGRGTPGFGGDAGPATAAGIEQITDIALDTNGNMYVADAQNYRVRKIDTFGMISTVAGTGVGDYSGDGGPAASAKLDEPMGLAVDNFGQVYIADYYNVRKIDTFGVITTVAGRDTAGFGGDGGPATQAFAQPVGVAADNFGNIFIADWHNYRIRKVNSLGFIFTIAGLDTFGYSGDGGPAFAAALGFPRGISVDATGNNLLIADVGNNDVRKISAFGDGIKNQQVNENETIKLWPSPNYGTFSVKVSSPVSQQADVFITNTIGQKIKELTIITNQPTSITLDAPPGMYFVTTVTAQGRLCTKVMVQ